MLKFMALLFLLSFVLLFNGFAQTALMGFALFVATPFIYIVWHWVLAPDA